MPNNVASQFQADISNYIADETLPLARRQLVAYQFGDPLELPKGFGTTYTATRYQRIPLPFAPVAEGVPPPGETMTIQQVTATVLQWADRIIITDVAEMTIKHPLFKKATELVALQVAETLERNTMVALMAGTQVNYVNRRGSRGALVAGDVLDTFTVIRTDQALETLGAPRYMGDEQTDTKISAEAGGARASENPRAMPHYAAIIHPAVVADFRQNPTVINAWTYSDLNRLYNFEAGEWSGIRFCKSNMVPSFNGNANNANGLTFVGSASGGALNGTYLFIVTGSDTQNQYESQIYAVSAGVSCGTGTGSCTVTMPTITGYTYSVYLAVSPNSPVNLGLTTSGPTTGPYQGQATQLAPGASVVITGVGLPQVPPAAPGAGVTVYPTFVLGRGAYAQVVLDNVKFTYLSEPDKSDPHNQLRIVGWKAFWGTLLTNVQFFARIESVTAFGPTFG